MITRYWGKKPLLYSIRFHRKQVERMQEKEQDRRSKEGLHQLVIDLKQMEKELNSRPFDPFVCYHFQDQLARLEQKFLHWQKLHDYQESLPAQTSEVKISERKLQQQLNRVPIGKHRLPPLPYAYDALEPFIDEQTMRLHHDQHHLTYVEGLNQAEKSMERARQTGDYRLLKHWEREGAFHGAGHYLHTIFWYIMNPKGGGKPTGSLLTQIRKDFGSFARFQKHFSEAANQVEGGGWAVLVWSPRAHRLEILQSEKHQNLSQWDVIPLLVLDVWEHAYYLKYKNDRKKYIQNWWNVVYWPEVQKRFDVAKTVLWKPY